MSPFCKKEKSNHHFPELNRKKKFFSWLKCFVTPTKVASLLVVVVIMVGFIYLDQTNVTATQGYQIRELEKQINDLSGENKKLNLEYIELQSMANIVDSVSKLDLVAVGDVEVISSLGSSMARR